MSIHARKLDQSRVGGPADVERIAAETTFVKTETRTDQELPHTRDIFEHISTRRDCRHYRAQAKMYWASGV